MTEFDPQQQTEISRLIDSGTMSGDLSVLTRQVQGASAQNASDVASLTTRVGTLETRVPSAPLLNFVTGATGIYGPWTADFTGGSGIAPGTTSTVTVSLSAKIGSKTPIIVIGQFRDGSGSARCTWRAVRNSGSVDIVVFNTQASGNQFPYFDFVVIA